MEPTDSIERIYARRAATFGRRARRLGNLSSRFSYSRGGVFLLALACLVIAIFGSLHAVFFALSAILAVGFVILVVRHEAVSAAEMRCRAMATLNEHALYRVRRDWNRLPVPAVVAEPNDPPLARDLDLFGRSSLVQLLGGGGDGASAVARCAAGCSSRPNAT